MSSCLQYRIRRTVWRERHVMEATDSSYMAREWNRCCKLNQQKTWDANLKTCGNYSDLVTLSLTRMKTPRNYLTCADNWRSCRSPTQFSKILWLISICFNVVSGTINIAHHNNVLKVDIGYSNAQYQCLEWTEAPDSVFEVNERKDFKCDPNLFSFIDENAQYV